MNSAQTTTNNWISIINKSEKEHWKKLLRKIANGLLRDEPNERPQNTGLTEGLTSKALFFFELGRYFDETQYFEISNQLFAQCLNKFQQEPQKFDFADGLAGFGWTLERVRKFKEFTIKVDDFLNNTDTFLRKTVDYTCLTNNMDFFWGLPGVMQYFIVRHEEDANYKTLEKYLSYVEEKYMRSDSDDCFYNAESGNAKVLNLTMAHGLPAMTATLLAMYQRGLWPKRLKPIINRFIDFIISTEIKTVGCRSHYSFIIDKEKPAESSRMGWCQGDLILALLFLRVAQTFNNNELKNKAINILLHSTERKSDADTSVVDTSFCHGTAGLAHMFNRAYQYSNNNQFYQTAHYWLEKTYQMGIHHPDFTEYQAMMNGSQMEPTLERADGLTMGGAGVGLTIIAALSNQPPNWDSALLLSGS